MKPLHVLITSNAPYIGSGYGVQTDLMARVLLDAGHRVTVRALYGHRGAALRHGSLTILPSTHDEWANDALVSDWRKLRPNVSLVLCDAWVFHEDALNQFPVTMYAPVDHTPIPPRVKENLDHCRWVWAMSRHGEREMRKAGLDPFYVPHMTDTEQYAPVDRAESRRKWLVPDGAFYVVSVAANKGYPSRKNLDAVLKAWSLFVRENPDAILHLHTNPLPTHHGLDLSAVARFYRIPDANLRFPDPLALRDGEYTPEMLNHLYNAADVFLLPSAGEGFGIPALDAQAAGCPVILTDFTAQTELCFSGSLIPVDPVDDLMWSLQSSEQVRVPPSKILRALRSAVAWRGNQAMRDAARLGAIEYDLRAVGERFLLPAMQIMAQANADWRSA